MKIIAWNCNMAYRRKANRILSLNPDIVVVPECECPERLKFDMYTPEPKEMVWFGDNPKKGLGIFSYSEYRFKLHEWYNPAFKNIIPLAVSNGSVDFNLFAIWANNPADPDYRYVGQTWKAINHYDSRLADSNTILVGDFNSNVIWDKKHRIGNHSDVVRFLEGKGIHSTYHHLYQQLQGKEEHTTLFMHRHKDKPYHIDYCFASADFINKLNWVQVGNYDEWIADSDHMPLCVEFGV